MDIEQKLVTPLPRYALEQLRVRFLYAATTDHDLTKSARAAAQMAYETEIGAAILKIVPVPPDIPATPIPERRRYLDIDTDMRKFSFLIEPALDDATNADVLPAPYIQLMRTHLTSGYPQYRTCAVAALLLVSAQILIDPAGP